MQDSKISQHCLLFCNGINVSKATIYNYKTTVRLNAVVTLYLHGHDVLQITSIFVTFHMCIVTKDFTFRNIGRVIEHQTQENDMVIKYKIREYETGYRTQKWGK